MSGEKPRKGYHCWNSSIGTSYRLHSPLRDGGNHEMSIPVFTETTPQVMLLIFCTVFFAGLVHGTLGLGFPMVATPLLVLQTDVLSAILIVLLPTLTVNLQECSDWLSADD